MYTPTPALSGVFATIAIMERYDKIFTKTMDHSTLFLLE